MIQPGSASATSTRPAAAAMAIELCGGREGDDSYVKIERDNPQFCGLLAVILDAIWATEIDE